MGHFQCLLHFLVKATANPQWDALSLRRISQTFVCRIQRSSASSNITWPTQPLPISRVPLGTPVLCSPSTVSEMESLLPYGRQKTIRSFHSKGSAAGRASAGAPVGGQEAVDGAPAARGGLR